MTDDCGQLMIMQSLKSPNHVNSLSLASADFWGFQVEQLDNLVEI